MNLKFKIKNSKLNQGFTLVELLIGVSVFVVIVVSVYGAYTSIFNAVSVSRAKINAIDLVNEQLEIVRNMPYSDVGISGGIPSGTLLHSQTLIRDSISFSVLTTVRNVDDPFDGTLGGNPNDTAPADFKIVEIEISCASCKNFKPMVVTTRVAPKNLENTSSNGALFVRVFDANGVPIQGASVHIENNKVSPSIIVDDVTNNQGMLQIVDVPPGVNAYEITVTKNGYSLDKTYESGVSNPNPSKPHATVAVQQVTQLSFVIDRLSSFSVSSLSDSCVPIAGYNFNIAGSKKIGTNPDILKYSQDKITGGGGTLNISNMEWDTYNFSNTDSTYEIVGINPLTPVSLLPNSNQNVQLIITPKNPKTLLITVRDAVTNLPLSGVSVVLTKTGYSSTKISGEGFIRQTDWSGGGGQATSTDDTKYLSSDGNIENNSPAGDISLRRVFGEYVPAGSLVSSAFDTGLNGNFQNIEWLPVDQPASSNVRFQVATSDNGSSWNFSGPDGTASTFYTNSNKKINSLNNGNRYLKYKIFLDTTSTSTSSNISDVYFTFTSSCMPPGQVYYSGLTAGTYNAYLSKSGFVEQNVSVTVSPDWQTLDVVLQSN